MRRTVYRKGDKEEKGEILDREKANARLSSEPEYVHSLIGGFG